MGKFLLVGASRGLGWATAQKLGLIAASGTGNLGPSGDTSVLGLSRKAPVGASPENFQWAKWDAAGASAVPELIEFQKSFRAERLIYFVGGGPYGPFEQKQWKDHEWSWEVSFRTPALLLHTLMRERLGLKQLVFIGSAIAGDRPDPEAAAYSAAKHALRGLVTSVQEELRSASGQEVPHSAKANAETRFAGDGLDLRLYSPGYMNTALLPKNAWPRHEAHVLEPEVVAQDLLDWLGDPSQVRCHRTYI